MKWIAQIGASILALLAIIFSSRNAGKTAARKEQLEDELAQAKKSVKIDNSVRDLDDRERKRRMRKYTRD